MLNLESDEVKCDLGLMSSLIASDKKEEFVCLVKRQLESSGSGICSLRLREILTRICVHQATDCATALIAGETGLKVDLHAALIGGEYPLHLAAHNLSYDLVKLFLEHGSPTNVATDDEKLPLQVAIEATSHHAFLVDWTPAASIFKLIYLLCIPYPHTPLKVVKLLSIHTATEDVWKVARYCVEEGKLVQLAVLLMVDGERLLEPLPGYESHGAILGLYIAKKLSFMIREKYKLIADGKNGQLQPYQQMRELMLFATLLQQVFERAGSAIQEYCFSEKKYNHCAYVADDITTLLREFRFFGPEECTDFSTTHLQKACKEKLKESILRLKPSVQCLSKPIKRISHEESFQPRAELTTPVPRQLVRSFHSCSGPITTSGVRSFAPAGTQSNGIIAQLMHPVIPKFKTATHIGVLALNIKKRIRY